MDERTDGRKESKNERKKEMKRRNTGMLFIITYQFILIVRVWRAQWKRTIWESSALGLHFHVIYCEL